jgi:hypothetical protein
MPQHHFRWSSSFFNNAFMPLKYFPLLAALLLVSVAGNAQRVKRKGVQPTDVSKNKGQAPGYAGLVFTIEQFTGKWQEASRTNMDTTPMPITDTLLLNFTAPGKVITRDGNQSNIVGEAAIDAPGNVLLAAADVYTIVSADSNHLVLDDQEGYLHTFNRTAQFTYEGYGKNTIGQDVYTSPISISLADIMGKWSVYRKQAKPGAITASACIIRQLAITEKTGESAARGEVDFYQKEKSEALPCIIRIINGGMAITAGNYSWQLPVYKADAKELVFGDPSMLLYFARLL